LRTGCDNGAGTAPICVVAEVEVVTRTYGWLAIVIALVVEPLSASGLNHTPASIRGVSQAYGFVLGQEYTLNRISTQFRELETRVEYARAKFSVSFPAIGDKLAAELTTAMGVEKFGDLRRGLEAKLQQTIGSQPLTPETAAAFLDHVVARAEGKIESPVFEYLLAVKYADNPVGEFFDRFRARFSTADHPKARGIKLAMQLPRSWAPSEGERPHIVQKWTSEHGTGLGNIMLDIRDAEGYEPEAAEIERLVSSGEVKQSLPGGASYVDSGTFSIERRRGYWVRMKMAEERAGFRIYQNVVMYQFFFRGSAIGVLCSAGGEPGAVARVDDAAKRMSPLCQQVVNSLVLEQRTELRS
jgi:hypothetical protein